MEEASMAGVKGRSGGHNRKPTALHVLDGTFRADRHNDAEPKPTAGAPSCPTWLDREAKAEWRRIVPELERLGLLTVVDRAALTCYCQAWSELNDATRVLKRAGRYQAVGEDGHLTPHPALAHQRAAWKAVKDFCALFGLDPSSRTRLKGKDEKPKGISSFARNRA
jgi:P27 family predicted phage terminase small subunit